MTSNIAQTTSTPPISDILKERGQGNTVNYRTLCALTSDFSKIPEDNALGIFRNLRGCVGLLNQDTRDLVKNILNVNWSTITDPVLNELCQLLISLAVGHVTYTELVLTCIVRKFIPDIPPTEKRSIEEIEASSGDRFRRLYEQAHACLKTVLKIFPMFKEKLQRVLCDSFPYIRRHHMQIRDYVRNLSLICTYAPSLEIEIIRLIIEETLKLDAICSKENSKKPLPAKDDVTNEAVESMMEVDSNEEIALKQLAKIQDLSSKLDTLLLDIIAYLNVKENGKEEKFLITYRVFLEVFERTVLPVFSSGHVSYVWFYICSRRQDLCNHFLNWLWAKIRNPTTDSILRQSSAYYLAALLARANFVSLKQCKNYLILCVSWLLQYADTQDCARNPTASKHPLFYAMCQAVFYLVVARHKDIIDHDGNCDFLKNLRLDRLITSKLNPLNFCAEIVAASFASVSRNYQFAFCYGIIERNRRTAMYETCDVLTDKQQTTSTNRLEWFFPFEPNFLEKSAPYFEPHCRHFERDLNDELSNVDQISKISVADNMQINKQMSADVEDEFLSPEDLALSRSLEKSYGKTNFIVPPTFGAMPTTNLSSFV